MCGLVQALIITNTFLKEHLQQFEYEPVPITSGFWHHKNNVITFTLMVDDFRVR